MSIMDECTEYHSLLMEHDVLMDEYEARAGEIEKLPSHERCVSLAISHDLLRAAESALEIAKIHKRAHGC